jgi:RNA 2',3'-cyclic 3'-phosphodiesterase
MTRGAVARLFVAVDPPSEVREQLLAWARAAVSRVTAQRRGGAFVEMRLLDPEALHVTLCFLGGRAVGEIEQIGAALHSCAHGVGELSLGAPLWLPPRRPRTLAVEVHDRDGDLARLHGAVRRAIAEAIDWQPERRRFRAHISVARMRGRSAERRPYVAREPALPATPPLSFVPSAIVLYRSWLSPQGASYEALASCDLLAAER